MQKRGVRKREEGKEKGLRWRENGGMGRGGKLSCEGEGERAREREREIHGLMSAESH